MSWKSQNFSVTSHQQPQDHQDHRDDLHSSSRAFTPLALYTQINGKFVFVDKTGDIQNTNQVRRGKGDTYCEPLHPEPSLSPSV